MSSTWPEEAVTAGLMAMIAWAGNASAASRQLAREGTWQISAAVLTQWRTLHGARYDQLREKYAGQMEANLAHEFRDVARLAVEVERLALEKTVAGLVSGEERDPSRAAANAARVAQSSTDKLLSITGRPTQITETRGLQEILRSLAAKGVLQLPEVTDADSTEAT